MAIFGIMTEARSYAYLQTMSKQHAHKPLSNNLGKHVTCCAPIVLKYYIHMYVMYNTTKEIMQLLEKQRLQDVQKDDMSILR